MGKKGSSNTKKGSSGVDKAPRCNCEDPYKCICGNRPPRPSKGHKWDHESQEWGGKGHKQKGGSGQTSVVGTQAKTTSVGKTTLLEWQKLPSKLLEAFCSKEKRPSPKFKSLEGCKEGNFKYRVIIQDPKVTKRGGEHDLIYIPAVEVLNEEQAREEAALLALLHLTPTIPHEKSLPEPYKTTWLNALANLKQEKSNTQIQTQKQVAITKPSSTNEINTNNNDQSQLINTTSTAAAAASSNLVLGNTYTSLAERRQKLQMEKKEQNAKIRQHEAFRTANKDAQVFMSAHIRKQIESLLRGDVDEQLLNELTLTTPSDRNTISDDEEDDDHEADDIIKRYVIERLSHEGFSKSQAKTSYKAILKNSSTFSQSQALVGEDKFMDLIYEDCLQWLCVHLNEDQLPEGFDPRGRTLDVILPPKVNKATIVNINNSSNEEVQSIIELYGLNAQEASLLLTTCTKESVVIHDVLYKALLTACDLEYRGENNLTGDSIELCKQVAQDELDVLQSMFVLGEDLHLKKDDKTVEMFIDLPSLHELDCKTKKLHITYDQGLYPRTYPIAFVENGWKEGQGSMLQIMLTKFIHSLPQHEPMIFEIFGHVQHMLNEYKDSDWTENSLISVLEGGKASITSSVDARTQRDPSTTTNEGSKVLSTMITPTRERIRRPRENSFFWSKTPSQTPPATAFPNNISKSMKWTRQQLPAAKAKEEFLSVMKMADSKNGVVLVTGETGCGKTTQIPQFILEEAPETAKIVVAQPRRLAAVGVADRVAKERGEEKAGEGSVGYVVRGDVAMSNSTRIMFCTTGVLLRQLQSEGALDCITHIVIDEVHERHLDTDVLIGILKESKPPHLKIVLMSATMDADRFAAYWGPQTPRMHIPGFTYPVKDYTLEDVISLTRYIPPKNPKNKSRYSNKSKKQYSSTDSERLNDDENMDGSPEEEENIDAFNANTKPLPLPVEDLVKRVGDDVDYDIIAVLVRHLVQSKDVNDDGSILVFLPGAPEISRAEQTILRLTNGKGILLLPLHGGLQPKEQQRVFQSAPKGMTKVILSTNVAETSITIPDCTIVIDTCKEKQSSYDPSNRMPLLIETFASRDSLKQRRGRAGRVRSGTCYKLISKGKLEKLPEHGEPEIMRCALDQTILSLIFLGVEQSSGSFLSKLLDPPSQSSIDAAIFSLEKLGAIYVKERTLSLTPLGIHLAAIPAPPCVGKILVMGSILGCRSAALAVAAGMSVGKSPFIKINSFVDSKNNRIDGDDDEQDLKNRSILQERKKVFESVGNSDLALLAATFLAWDDMQGGGGGKKKFCESLGLSTNVIRDMKQMVNQLDGSLCAAGFRSTPDSDQNGKSWRIIRSCIVSALAPSQIVRVQRSSKKYTETATGAVEKDGIAQELKFYTRGDTTNASTTNDDMNQSSLSRYHGIPEERVFIHPSSANFSVGDYSCPWIVYHELVRTSKPFLRDVNECNIYDLLLFGGALQVSSSDGVIIIDNYVRLSANARIGALVGGLRKKVDELLSQKVANPSMDIAKSAEMKLIVKLLRTDGLGR